MFENRLTLEMISKLANMEIEKIKSIIEAILFAAGRVVKINEFVYTFLRVFEQFSHSATLKVVWAHMIISFSEIPKVCLLDIWYILPCDLLLLKILHFKPWDKIFLNIL